MLEDAQREDYQVGLFESTRLRAIVVRTGYTLKGGHMRRRAFLAGSLTTAGALATRAAHAQPGNRAAVVIGVDKVGDLPKLNAAASGARTVADWLQDEGFEVKRFIDGQKPVVVGDIKASIRALVERGTLEQLVIYFAGHGFIGLSSEFWLLSDARQDPDAAISLTEARDASRQLQHPQRRLHLGCVSLARRQSTNARTCAGSVVFPNAAPTGRVDHGGRQVPRDARR